MIAAIGASVPEATVRTKIDEILLRPEFGGRENLVRKWFVEQLEKFLHAIGDLLGIQPRHAADALVVLTYVALGTALVWIVWRIVRARLDRARPTDAGVVEADPVAVRRARVADLRRSARAAHAAGDRVLALRLYFTALVVGLGEKGDLEYRDAWTNRELLERGEPSERVERELRPLVRDLDAKSFGGMPAFDEDVAAMSRVVDQLLGAETR